MTKTQKRRALQAIKQKARKLWDNEHWQARGMMSTQDMLAIEKICDKYLKRF
jgi:hypothetical protein